MSYERPGKGAGFYVCWHRSEHDNYDHAVTDEEFYRGRQALSQGQYEALCGHMVLTTSMLVPPGRPCPSCHAFFQARSTLPTVEQRMQPIRHHKPAFLRRLFRRPQPPSVPHLIPRQRPRPAPERDWRTGVPAGVGGAPNAPVPAGRHARWGER